MNVRIISMRRATIVAVVVAVASGAGVLGATRAATGQTTSATARTIHLVESGGGLSVVDNPPKAKHQFDFSPGDIVVVTRVLEMPSGRRAGSLRLVCVAVGAATQHCDGTESLAGGTLEFGGLSTPEPTTKVAVVGGTGVYAGSKGTSVSTDRAGHSDVADQTVTLLP